MSDSHEHLEETFPARAQFKALRLAASVLLQLAVDIKDPDQPEIREIAGAGRMSEVEVGLVAQAISDLAQELDLRAEQVWHANVEYLSLFARRN